MLHEIESLEYTHFLVFFFTSILFYLAARLITPDISRAGKLNLAEARSPARYYLELRLNKARLLLLQTNMSIIDVALACGFVSASHFSKCYRDYFGRTPRKERGLPTDFGPVAAAATAT